MPSAAATAKRETLALWLALASCSALLVATQWVVPYLPTNDGPQHVFSGHAQNNYLPGSIFVTLLQPNLRITYYGFDALFMPLEATLGWQNALRVSLSVITLAFAWGFVALVRSLEPKRAPWSGLLGFPLALSWHLYAGFFAYLAAVGVGLWILALGRAPRRLLGRVALGLALFFQAAAHVFGFLLTFGVLVVLSALPEDAEAPTPRRWQPPFQLLLTALPALALVAGTALGSIPKTNFDSAFKWLSLRELALPGLIFPGPAWRAWLSLAALVAAGACVFRPLRWRALGSRARSLAVLGTVLVALVPVLPFDLPDWQFFSPRGLPLGLALVLACVGPLSTRAGLGLAIAVGAWLTTSIAFHRDLARRFDDDIAGLFAPVHRQGVSMAVPLDVWGGLASDPARSELPHIAPLTHWPALYAAALGGCTSNLFVGGSAVHAFVARPAPDLPMQFMDPARFFGVTRSAEFASNPGLRRAFQAEVATVATRYESVTVLGARPTDLQLWRDWGYREDWQRGSVLLAHFVGCPLSLQVSGMPEPKLGRVAVAIEPAKEGLLVDLSQMQKRAADGALQLPQLPCGKVALRPFLDVNRDDEIGQGDRFCRQAGPDGKLHVQLSSGAALLELRCDF